MPFGRERPQRREVRRETHRGGHRGELLRRARVEDLQGQPRRRMNAQRPSHDAEREGDLHRAVERAVVARAPRREGLIAPVARRERVGAGLDRAPVVARRHHHGVDAVHDPLVVRRGPVGVSLGELRRAHHAITHLVARHRLRRERAHRNAAPHADAAPIREVREDAQPHGSARERGQHGGELLGHGVHEVGAHRVAHVDHDVNHVEPVAEVARLDRPRAAAARHEAAHRRVGHREQRGLRRVNA